MEFTLNGDRKGMFVIGEDTSYFKPCVTVWASTVVELRLSRVSVRHLNGASGFRCVDTRPVGTLGTAMQGCKGEGWRVKPPAPFRGPSLGRSRYVPLPDYPT